MEKMESAQQCHDTSIAAGNSKSSTCVEISSLNDDLLIEILKRLPAKCLFVFSCVSKKRCSLISHEILEKNPPLVMSAMLFEYYPCWYGCDFHGSLIKYNRDFFPVHSDPRIIDSCNGLVLWYDHSFGLKNIYVSDPITKKSVLLPEYFNKGREALLEFDPSVSSHFKAISLYGTRMEIFSSETGKSVVHWVELSHMSLSKKTMCCLNGFFYIVLPPTHIVAINLNTGQCSKIELPVDPGLALQPGLILGKSGGFLQYVGRKGGLITVWMLKQDEKKEWVLKHCFKIKTLIELILKDVPSLHFISLFPLTFVAFHPRLKVVFFWVPGNLLSYHLEKEKIELLYDFESKINGEESQFRKTAVGDVQLCVFPFLGNALN